MKVLSVASLLISVAFSAQAQAQAQVEPGDLLIAQLRARGYVILSQELTWLGRKRVVVANDQHRRELVFYPATGEILRDYAVGLDRSASNNEDNTMPTAGSTAAVESTGGQAALIGEPVVTHAPSTAP